jgi:hypothetical protein
MLPIPTNNMHEMKPTIPILYIRMIIPSNGGHLRSITRSVDCQYYGLEANLHTQLYNTQ